MKYFLLLLIPFSLVAFKPQRSSEPEAKTYLRLYTLVSGTGEEKVENWLLANNGTRRIIATIEIISPQENNPNLKETRNIIVEAKTSVTIGPRSENGSAPNNVIIVNAVFTPQTLQ